MLRWGLNRFTHLPRDEGEGCMLQYAGAHHQRAVRVHPRDGVFEHSFRHRGDAAGVAETAAPEDARRALPPPQHVPSRVFTFLGEEPRPSTGTRAGGGAARERAENAETRPTVPRRHRRPRWRSWRPSSPATGSSPATSTQLCVIQTTSLAWSGPLCRDRGRLLGVARDQRTLARPRPAGPRSPEGSDADHPPQCVGAPAVHRVLAGVAAAPGCGVRAGGRADGARPAERPPLAARLARPTHRAPRGRWARHPVPRPLSKHARCVAGLSRRPTRARGRRAPWIRGVVVVGVVIAVERPSPLPLGHPARESLSDGPPMSSLLSARSVRGVVAGLCAAQTQGPFGCSRRRSGVRGDSTTSCSTAAA